MFSQLAQGVDWSSMGAMALRIVAWCCCAWWSMRSAMAWRPTGNWGTPPRSRVTRLSLNPIHHLDPFGGLLMMVVVGFGWSQARAGGPRYFRKPKRGMAITALAGPVSNFLLAYVSAILYSGLYAVLVVRGETTGLALALEFFGVLMTLNIGLGIFNLIPFPPLDGSKVVAMFLSDRQYVQWMRLERYGTSCADGRPLVRAAGRLSGGGRAPGCWTGCSGGPPSPTPGCSPC
ncbi:MAG: site-2 protease family protein [Evtepia gabavorous]